MGKNIVEKIFDAHREYGSTEPGSAVGLRVDEVYTQDATGTMVWLQFEAIGVGGVGGPAPWRTSPASPPSSCVPP
jgi:aconitate hydratase